MTARRSKTGGGPGTNGHQVKGTAKRRSGAGSPRDVATKAATICGGRPATIDRLAERLNIVRTRRRSMLTQGTHYRRPLASNVVDADIALARGDKDSLRLLQSRVEFHAGMGALVFGDSRAESASFRIESEDRDKTMDPGQAEGFRLWMESELNDRDLDFPRGEVIVQMLVPDYQLENVPYGTFGVAMWERVRDLHGSAIGDPPAEWEDEHQAFMEGVKSPLR